MDDKSRIPNELSEKFNTVSGRKRLIELYKDSNMLYSGINSDKESVNLSISNDGMTLETYQSNGWIRINYYDRNGVLEGESFRGKWR